MPHRMYYCPEAILLGERVYIGAGNSRVIDNTVVMVYNIPNDEWSSLPEYDSYWFGMTSVNNELTLVGGVMQQGSGDRTNQLGTWNEKLNCWTHALPPMPTARSGPTVDTYKNRWIIVAGGYNAYRSISTVEVLDMLIGHWYRASPLPVRQYKMSSTIIGNMWYLLGGYISIPSSNSLCACICIDDLIYDAVFQTPSPSPWQSLPNTPASKCTALNLRGSLLAVGGNQCSYIYHYKPSCNEWVQVGELPSRRTACACTILPNGEMFVAGGDNSYQEVDVGSLK